MLLQGLVVSVPDGQALVIPDPPAGLVQLPDHRQHFIPVPVRIADENVRLFLIGQERGRKPFDPRGDHAVKSLELVIVQEGDPDIAAPAGHEGILRTDHRDGDGSEKGGVLDAVRIPAQPHQGQRGAFGERPAAYPLHFSPDRDRPQPGAFPERPIPYLSDAFRENDLRQAAAFGKRAGPDRDHPVRDVDGIQVFAARKRLRPDIPHTVRDPDRPEQPAAPERAGADPGDAIRDHDRSEIHALPEHAAFYFLEAPRQRDGPEFIAVIEGPWPDPLHTVPDHGLL